MGSIPRARPALQAAKNTGPASLTANEKELIRKAFVEQLVKQGKEEATAKEAAQMVIDDVNKKRTAEAQKSSQTRPATRQKKG